MRIKIIPNDKNYDKIIEDLCNERLEQLFNINHSIPLEARARLREELDSAVCNGFGAKYYAAMKIAEKAKADGIVLGFKGTINAS
ncbi:MAG: hypothetical protein HUJ70_02260, partial [Pseudobutyrivibrio sp.]|nr:hypothetical protein [Pseudobutyrivibrio sp.]